MLCAPQAGSAQSGAEKELAPSGSLRVAIATAPAVSTFFSTLDSATGRPRGVAVDLGADLALKLGVPVTYVHYRNSGDLTAGATRGEWDVSFMPVDEERARVVDFGPAYNLFESTYLVPATSTIRTLAEVDQPGVRIAVIGNTTTGRSAERQIKRGSLRSYRTVDELRDALAGNNVDAVGLSTTSLRMLAAMLPGARILDGSFHSTANAVAVPKNRPAALAFVSEYIEAAKASGEVRRAFDRAGLTDAVVAP